jgi:exodeoxyribonuclease V gamma subunit
VTFCTLVPMRSIPFQVVCLIGMNNDTYPRPHRPPDFDLMLTDFRKGDRSRRQDDRYLFLEALISARRCLYLSYVGNSIRDNSVIPPSVLLSELLDVIDQGFCVDSGPAQQHILTRHPLQSFSRHYFTADSDNRRTRLFSYSQELAELSRAAGQSRSDAPSFIDAAVPAAEAEWRQLDSAQLIRFFHHPARFFLRERLGIQLLAGSEPLPDHEPFVLDGLTAYQLRARLLELQQAQHAAHEAYAIVRGSAVLPHGQIGSSLFEQEWESVQRFAGRLQRFLPDLEQEPLALDLTLTDMRISGWLPQLTSPGLLARQGLFGYRLAPVTARDYLSLWLQHLLLNVLAPAGIDPVSHWLGQDKQLVLRPVSDAHAQLEWLLAYYWQGLSRPLAFFPKTAFAYIEAATAKNPSASPENKARQIWEGNEWIRGEAQDPYYQLAFRGRDPFAEEFIDDFIALARQVVLPIFAHLENTD